VDFLKAIVRSIYDVIRRTEKYVGYLYPHIKPWLPDEITFLHSEELEAKYPDLTPKERENRACRSLARFSSSESERRSKTGNRTTGGRPITMTGPHPRWTATRAECDILVHYPLFNRALELSSMGFGSTREPRQAARTDRHVARRELMFHRRLLLVNCHYPSARYRAVATLYVLPAKSSHRRNPGKPVARGDGAQLS